MCHATASAAWHNAASIGLLSSCCSHVWLADITCSYIWPHHISGCKVILCLMHGTSTYACIWHVQDVNAKIIDALAKYVFLVPSPSQVGE